MPSVAVTMDAVSKTAVSERKNAVVIPTSMTIDNDGGAQDHAIEINDQFTPSAYYGVASPSQETKERYKTTVLQGDVVTLNEEDLKGVKCLGAVLLIIDVLDANCHITLGYKHE